MMTARMMMLNWVQETSVRAAVVLSVGLPRLVSRAWVVAALSRVVELVVEVEGGALVGMVEVIVVEGVADMEVEDFGASVVVLGIGVGMIRAAGRVQLWARASPVKPGAHNWQRGPAVLLMQLMQCPVSERQSWAGPLGSAFPLQSQGTQPPAAL